MALIELSENIIDNFLINSSFTGLRSIYAIKLSFDNKIAFNKNNFTKEIFFGAEDYFYGFIIACYAVGLIDFNMKDDVVTITGLNNHLSARIVGIVEELSLTNELRKQSVDNTKKYFE